jgi:hypothetical protein
MKLPYTRKATFNINGTIHVALAIPLNKGMNKLKSLFDENRDGLIKNHMSSNWNCHPAGRTVFK